MHIVQALHFDGRETLVVDLGRGDGAVRRCQEGTRSQHAGGIVPARRRR
jgi:hypothetical protein